MTPTVTKTGWINNAMTALHVLGARLTDLITMLAVATFLTTCSADRGLVKHTGFNAGAAQDVLAAAFAP